MDIKQLKKGDEITIADLIMSYNNLFNKYKETKNRILLEQLNNLAKAKVVYNG